MWSALKERADSWRFDIHTSICCRPKDQKTSLVRRQPVYIVPQHSSLGRASKSDAAEAATGRANLA